MPIDLVLLQHDALPTCPLDALQMALASVQNEVHDADQLVVQGTAEAGVGDNSRPVIARYTSLQTKKLVCSVLEMNRGAYLREERVVEALRTEGGGPREVVGGDFERFRRRDVGFGAEAAVVKDLFQDALEMPNGNL